MAHLDRRFVVARLRADGQPPDGTESRSKSRKVGDLGRKRDSLWIVEQHNATFRFEYERIMRNEQKALQRQSQGEISSSGIGYTAKYVDSSRQHQSLCFADAYIPIVLSRGV